MHLLQPSYLFTLPKPLTLTLAPPSPSFPLRHRPPPLLRRTLTAKSFSSDEFPVDESLPEALTPTDKETEDEARRRNWIERGWAPWEEILTPEGDFARKSLNEGEEVPLRNPEAIESFKMLTPKYRRKKMEEMGITEEEYYEKQFEMKGEIPEAVETYWAGPTVVRMVAPRDWPPRGWEVDREELGFIREGHRMMGRRVSVEELDSGVSVGMEMETDGMCLERYKVFLKQYNEWVEANKDRLEEESYQVLLQSHAMQCNVDLVFSLRNLVSTWSN